MTLEEQRISNLTKPGETPERMAHFVVRTNRYEEMVTWYAAVLNADVVYADNNLTFLAFDEEHHRLAIANIPELVDAPENVTAIDHVAFTYSDLSGLIQTYERLRAMGILPVHAYNHGPTTSFYYADPNGNKIELQVDNFPTLAEAAAYFRSDAFAANAIGVPLDPNLLLEKWRQDIPQFELLRPGNELIFSDAQ